MKSTARHRTAINIILALIAVMMTMIAPAPARLASRGMLHSSSVQDDYDASWQRLATYLNGLQSIGGLVSSYDLAPVVASLNSALARLDLARNALDKGQTGQASASITQANTIMDAIDPSYQALQAQARN